MRRETRIDLLRGYAILTIALNHLTVMFIALGLRGPSIPTLTYHGFSSAAEIFFLVSGYMVGMVYLPKPNLSERLWSRAAKIYAFNVLAFAMALLVAWWFGPPLALVTSAATTLADPAPQILRFLLLLQHPDLLGVLWLYVLFMAAAPLAIWLARRQPALALGLSVALYALVQLTHANLPGGSPKGDYLWNFNPFAWQLIFFAGIHAGYRRWHEALFPWLEARRLRPVLVIALLVLSIVLHAAGIQAIIPSALLSQERLGALRIAHTVLVVVALAALMVVCKPWLTAWPVRLVEMCGRQTLNCYVASVPLTYALAGLWHATGGSHALYLVAGAAILLLMVAVAAWSERKRAVPSRRLALAPVTQRH